MQADTRRALLVYLAVAYTPAYLLDTLLAAVPWLRAYRLAFFAARMWLPFLGVVAALWSTGSGILEGLRRVGVRLCSLRYIALGVIVPYALYGLGVLYAALMGFRPSNPAEAAAMLSARARLLYTLLGPRYMLAMLLVEAAAAGLTVNALFALGEEVGWRGLLYTLLYPRYGLIPASILVGLAWGLWHAPLILLLGFNYPHHRGPLALAVFCLLTIAWTIIMNVLRAASGSVLPVSVLHGTLNALGGVMLLTFPRVDELYTIPVGYASLAASYTLAAILVAAYRGRVRMW